MNTLEFTWVHDIATARRRHEQILGYILPYKCMLVQPTSILEYLTKEGSDKSATYDEGIYISYIFLYKCMFDQLIKDILAYLTKEGSYNLTKY